MKNKNIIIIILLVILIIVFFPYIKAEFLTFKYGDKFIDLEKQTNMLENFNYHKVISYSKNKATVYYVSDTGDLIMFVKEDNHWKLAEWKTLWSNSGSADNFYWPYYS